MERLFKDTRAIRRFRSGPFGRSDPTRHISVTSVKDCASTDFTSSESEKLIAISSHLEMSLG